jgi:hypothetical protein
MSSRSGKTVPSVARASGPGYVEVLRGGRIVVASPEQQNYEQIERLQQLLTELRASASTARETEAIREIGLEIAVAIREVGAMLVNVGWEQSYAAERSERPAND